MATPELKTYAQTFTTNNAGVIFMTDILRVAEYSKINVEVIQWPQTANMSVECMIGKLSGSTLAQVVARFPLGTTGTIHTFDVIGPEFSVALVGGPPNTSVPIQGWVLLH